MAGVSPDGMVRPALLGKDLPMNARRTLIAITAALIAGTTAYAQTSSVAVHYGDLNTRSAEGRATLNHRLVEAASTVCGADQAGNGLYARMMASNCMREVMTTAKIDLASRTSVKLASR